MAANNSLSDKAIRAAIKAASAASKSRKLSDGAGLVLDVRPTGSAWWRFRYWIDSREGMLSLGTYPDVSLSDARARRDEARQLVAAGTDPSTHRKESRQAAKQAEEARMAAEKAAARGEALPGTFEAVAREWAAAVHRARVTEGHADRTLRRLEKDAFPFIGAIPLRDVDAPAVLAMLRRVEGRGVVETAHRIKNACGQVFRYGIAAGLCDRNPAADLRDALKTAPVRHLPAIVDPRQAGELLRDMMAYPGHPFTRAALQLSALLFLRPGNIRAMRWAWVDFDTATLTIPSEAMKGTKAEKANRPPHVVPLAPQALAILRDELLPLSGGDVYVFPSLRGTGRPMSDGTVNKALRSMGYAKDEMVGHGFRAMARTIAAERLGIPPEVLEAQLAHAVPEAHGRAYNRTKYLAQRRETMAQWADYLDSLRAGAAVLAFKPRAA